MARRKKSENAKTDQETVSTAPEVTTTPDIQEAGEVEGMEANVADVQEGDVESIKVNENEEGEATNGTTKEGDTSPVFNTDKIPQNGVKKIEVLEVTDNPIAKEADENRTEEEVQFADESNPNQKGRNASAPTEYDQDGNLRTDGYSYGVAPDDTRGIDVDEAFEENRGEAKDPVKDKFFGKRVFSAERPQTDVVNQDDPNVEVDAEDVAKLEDQLSDKKNNISARVTSSTAGYYRIKFFRNNKPFVTYKSRGAKLDKREVKSFLNAALKEADGEA